MTERKYTRMSSIARATGHLLGISEDYAALAAFIVMLALVDGGVAVSMTIKYGSGGWEELARFSFVWLLLLGTASTSRGNSHLRMGFVSQKISSAKVRQIMEVVFSSICFLILCLLFWSSVKYVMWIGSQQQQSLLLKMDMRIVTSSFVIGFGLSAMHILIHLINDVRKLLNITGFVR